MEAVLFLVLRCASYLQALRGSGEARLEARSSWDGSLRPQLRRSRLRPVSLIAGRTLSVALASGRWGLTAGRADGRGAKRHARHTSPGAGLKER